MNSLARGLSVRLSERQIPVNDSVQSVCELLGFDPLYFACEGRVVAVVARETAESAPAALRDYAGSVRSRTDQCV